MPKICIEFAGKEEREQKDSYEYNTKHKPHSARNTGKKTGKETSIHKRHGLINREGMCIWETEAILVKRQGWDSHSEVPRRGYSLLDYYFFIVFLSVSPAIFHVTQMCQMWIKFVELKTKKSLTHLLHREWICE